VDSIFLHRWPWWAGGVAIGLFVLAFYLINTRLLGVSAGFRDVCAACFDSTRRKSWRLPFLAGIIVGGFVAGTLAGGIAPTFAMGQFDHIVSSSLPVKAAVFTLGGLLIGFGTALAGGCTSGHGIVGMARRSPKSMIATVTFFTVAFGVTNLLLRTLGV
jgi:uncharacterized membrane protein YedE/YeeE